MNIQTEHLENHSARITAEIDAERFEKAKQAAARKLANRVNIPGFRKGKAPYNIILNYFGEGALIEDAVEILGNDIYKEVLDESKVEPYGPGQLDKFDLKDDGTPVFTFVVPMQPSVELGDYRAVREAFEAPEVTDKDVDTAIKSLREQHAVVEESSRPVVVGDRITAYLDARVIEEDDDESEDNEDDADDVEASNEQDDAHDHEHDDDDDHDHDEDEEHDHDHGHAHHVDDRTVIHEHSAQILLDDEAIAPGFAAAVAGANVGETRKFELTYPDDEEEYDELAGKRVKFHVEVQKVENITLPALNDEFAARVTADEEKPLTLLELRMRVRENLQSAAEQRVKEAYSSSVLDKIVEGATVKFPEEMVDDQIQQYKEQLDRDLRRQGLTLKDYQRIYQKSDEDLATEFRPSAERAITRGLVLREVTRAENLKVADADIDAEIDNVAAQFGDRADDYRRLFKQGPMRESVQSDLLNRQVLDRIAAIGRDEAPELSSDDAADEPNNEDEAQATTEDVAEEKGESA